MPAEGEVVPQAGTADPPAQMVQEQGVVHL
jgi:hypothetical protein